MMFSRPPRRTIRLPPVVDSGPAMPSAAPPSDAIIFFDGKDLSQWRDIKDGALDDGEINVKKNGQISTKQEFGNCPSNGTRLPSRTAIGRPGATAAVRRVIRSMGTEV